LFANSFHADEALFAGWARLIAVWRDPLLLTQAVDKPPLLFYLQALFYPLFGPVEWAARMPSLIASLLLIPLTAQLARRLTGDRLAAVLAALLVAVSPLAVQFSATAFSDPLLAFWLVAALTCACRPAPFAAGLLFGLALATKYQALLFAPLWIGVLWLYDGRRQHWPRVAAGLGVVLAALFLWQMARPTAGALIAMQWTNIGGVRPARSWELLPRLLANVRLWPVALGWPVVVLGVGCVLGLVGFSGSRLGIGGKMPPGRRRSVDALLALFVLGYLLLHWLWAVPVWDRYLLPILPLVAILIGRGASLLWAAVQHATAARWAMALALVALAVAHLPTAVAARDGRFPLGGRPDADGGAAITARLLKDAPYGTVLYDHWYSWHWRYQLFDGRVYVSWFPHADALLADLDAFAGQGPPRYIALPSSETARPIIRRLSAGGYGLEPLDAPSATPNGIPSMTLYRIIAETAHE